MLNLAIKTGPNLANYDSIASRGRCPTWHRRPPLVLLLQEVIEAVEAATAKFPRDIYKGHALMLKTIEIYHGSGGQHFEHLQWSDGTEKFVKKSRIVEV